MSPNEGRQLLLSLPVVSPIPTPMKTAGSTRGINCSSTATSLWDWQCKGAGDNTERFRNATSFELLSSMQVALLFLARDAIPTEPVWTAFMAAAAGASLKHSVPARPHVPVPALPSTRYRTFDYPKPDWDPTVSTPDGAPPVACPLACCAH